MASDPRTPPATSNYPVSLGPGARPTNPTGDGQDARSRLARIMEARAKYNVSVEEDTLSLSYELNNAPRLYRLSFDSMPLHGFTRWWLYGNSTRARKGGMLSTDIIRGSENAVQRPVSQQEAEALTYWTSKRLVYGDCATLAAGVLGFYMARRGHARMKWPFLKPSPLERYNYFPLRRLPLVRGPMAQATWQFTRYCFYVQLVALAMTPFTSAIITLDIASRMSDDPRVKELFDAIKEKGAGRKDPTRIEWPDQRQSQAPGQARESDNENPQSGFSPDYSELDRGNSGGQSVDDAEAFNMKDTNEFSQPGNYPMSGQQSSRQVQSTRPSTSSDSDPFFYDDASPTAGNEPSMATSQSYGQASGGSVWDRIRRGSSPSRPHDSQPQESRAQDLRSSRLAEHESGIDQGDAYGRGARTGRDGRDRERAQREFDEMLEKERQQSGSGEYDRGTRAIERGEDSLQGGGDSGGMSVWERRRRG